MGTRADASASLLELLRPVAVADLDIERTSTFLNRAGFDALADLRDVEPIRKQLDVSLLMAHKLSALISVTRHAMSDERLQFPSFEEVCAELRALPHEELRGMYYSDNDEIIGVQTLACGVLDSVEISTYAALRPAFIAGARRMKLLHNHPSSLIEASASDVQFARLFGRISREAGVILESFVIVTQGEVREISL